MFAPLAVLTDPSEISYIRLTCVPAAFSALRHSKPRLGGMKGRKRSGEKISEPWLVAACPALEWPLTQWLPRAARRSRELAGKYAAQATSAVNERGVACTSPRSSRRAERQRRVRRVAREACAEMRRGRARPCSKIRVRLALDVLLARADSWVRAHPGRAGTTACARVTRASRACAAHSEWTRAMRIPMKSESKSRRLTSGCEEGSIRRLPGSFASRLGLISPRWRELERERELGRRARGTCAG